MVYRMMQAGELPVTRIGRAVRVSETSEERFEIQLWPTEMVRVYNAGERVRVTEKDGTTRLGTVSHAVVGAYWIDLDDELHGAVYSSRDLQPA
jgi:hypothetical protein